MAVSIEYCITDMDVDAHEFVVQLRVSQALDVDQEFSMAAWIPGSYMVRDFARNVTDISASDADGQVPLRKIDKQTWRLGRETRNLVLAYRVYAFDLSVRSAYLDPQRAFFNGTSLFLKLSGHEQAAWSVHIAAPHDTRCTTWRVATTLPVREVDSHGFGTYAGIAYDRLIDHPVEIGLQCSATFTLNDVEHAFHISDGGRFDIDRLCRDVRLICGEHAAMFGELPIDRYAFLTLATADGYGGLEHADSTSLVCKRADLPRYGLQQPDKGYRQFLGLCSHEYFHLWNVKRIRPAAFAQGSLSHEVHTELLWAFEGSTSYYDDLALARSGVVAHRDYLELLAATVTRVQRTPGRQRQTVAESSFDAWTKFYKQDENAPNAIVSYYAKGALVAFGLDVTLRRESNDAVCLDDLMRRLWLGYGKTGQGVPERGVEQEAAELLGKSLDDFFTRYVDGVDELPLDDWFAYLGVGYRLRPAKGMDDVGGYADDPASPSSQDSRVDLGVVFEAQPPGLKLARVLANGAARASGLAPGDVLIAVDGERVTAANLADLLQRAQGDAVRVDFFRRDLLQSVSVQCEPARPDTCELWLLDNDDLDAQVRHRRAAWFAPNHTAGA